MKFCRQNIYAHMKDVHKITLSDYEAQVGVKAKDIVPVEEMEPGAMIGQNHMAFVGHEGMSSLLLIMNGVPGGPEGPAGLGGLGAPGKGGGGSVGLEAIIGQNHMGFVGHSYNGSMILL